MDITLLQIAEACGGTLCQAEGKENMKINAVI